MLSLCGLRAGTFTDQEGSGEVLVTIRMRAFAGRGVAVGAVVLACAGWGAAEAGAQTLTVSKVPNQPGLLVGTVTSDPPGIDCGEACAAEFPPEEGPACDPPPPCFPIPQFVELTATGANGFVFDGWSGDCTGVTTPCLVTMNISKQVTAHFRDAQKPFISLDPITSPTRQDLVVHASASDNAAVSRVEFRVNGQLQATDTTPPYSASIDTRNFADGQNVVRAIAEDSSSLSAESNQQVVFDNTAPEISFTAGPNDGATVSSGDVAFAFSVTDATTAVTSTTCTLTRSGAVVDVSECSDAATFTALADGAYLFAVEAIDAVGNEAKVERAFTVARPQVPPPPGGGADPPGPADKTPPSIKRVKLKLKAEKRKAKLSFTATDDVTSKKEISFSCKVDRRKAKPCTSPLKLKRLKPGRHKVKLVAIDAAGNRSAPEKVRFRIPKR